MKHHEKEREHRARFTGRSRGARGARREIDDLLSYGKIAQERTLF
jgi:hypothetical protein